jgi:hypothetical protein
VPCNALTPCREEELRILRGEAAVDESRPGGRLTAGSTDSGGSSGSDDDDAGFVNDRRQLGAGAGMRGAAGNGRGLQQRQSFKQQQQQQQQAGAGSKVSTVPRAEATKLQVPCCTAEVVSHLNNSTSGI